jgi:hypothetical protein
MNYLPEESKVVYGSMDGKDEKVFDALECLAAITSIAVQGKSWW